MFGINIPSFERLARMLLGLALATYGWLAPAQPNLIVASIGICVALTGLIGFCPACAVAGRRLQRRD